MNYRGLKALRAFAFGVVLSGLSVACNEASQVAKTIAPEAEIERTAVSMARSDKHSQSPELTADEREAKKRAILTKPEIKEMSAGLEELAQAVAVVVEDNNLASRVYAKCNEKFDGETNVLWQHLEADPIVQNNGGWGNLVKTAADKTGKKAVINKLGNIKSALAKFERIMNAPVHLFWAFPANWDKKATPIIAFVPWNVDPDTRTSIPAFDSKGKRFELDNKGDAARKRPVIVLTFNERVDKEGRLKQNLLVPSSDGTFRSSTKSNATSSYIERGGNNHIMTPGPLSATTVRLDWVTLVNIPNGFDDFWWDGAPEALATCQLQQSALNIPSFQYVSSYWQEPWSNTSLGNFVNAPLHTFYPGTSYALLGSNNFQSWAVQFKYYEDDFTIGQWDVFDDWYSMVHTYNSQQYFYPTLNEFRLDYDKGTFVSSDGQAQFTFQ